MSLKTGKEFRIKLLIERFTTKRKTKDGTNTALHLFAVRIFVKGLLVARRKLRRCDFTFRSRFKVSSFTAIRLDSKKFNTNGKNSARSQLLKGKTFRQ